MTQRFSPSAQKWVEVVELPLATRPAARKRRMETAFVQVPLGEAAHIAKTTRNTAFFVWVWLLYEAWRTKNPTVTVTNGPLELYDIDRYAKYRALKTLANTGAITLHRCGRQAVVVTVNEKFL